MNGIILLDKPLGMSSNQALQRVKRLMRADKAGHIGSLDPLATGMLPICLGEATKVAGDILALRKCYQFTVKLGERTATGDVEGPVVETCDVPELAAEAIERGLRRFLGKQEQVPPMFSAIKKDGQPLYKLARAGIEIERKPREIEIFELAVLGHHEASLELQTLCSKGTYIRVLAEDLARAMGSCGHVTALRRLYVEPFSEDGMQTLESMERGTAHLLPADEGIPHLPAVHVDDQAAQRLRHGQEVQAVDAALAGRVRLYDATGDFMGIGECAGGMIRPRRLWVAGLPE